MKKSFCFFESIAVLIGTIIGAGVLAIPYAMKKAGFITGVINLLILGFATIVINVYLGEIILRTRKKHQLSGYAGKYLGAYGRKIMSLSMVLIIYGALTAYIIGVGRSLLEIFGMQNFQLNLFGLAVGFDFLFSILFFIFASSIVFFGIKSVGISELLMGSLVVVIMLFISAVSFGRIQYSNLQIFDISKIILPYGIILFALAGAVAIPEMQECLGKEKKKLKIAIITGSLIPVILYLLFSFSVLGVCGQDTQEIATLCLGQKLGSVMFWVGNLFAILAMATSFFALGLSLKEMYMYDYRMKERKSWFLACSIPLILFVLLYFGIQQDRFFKIIDLAGGIAMTLQGILIVLIFNKAKKLGERKPEYSIKQNKFISTSLILIFLLGMIYTLLHFFGLL